MLFSWGKMQKGWKSHLWETFFTSYLHNGSTLEHNSNRFRKLQCRATTLILAIFSNWSCDHHPNMLLNDLWQAESSLSWFSWLFGHTRSYFHLGPWHGPWRQTLIVYTLHTPTLFFLNLPLFFYLRWGYNHCIVANLTQKGNCVIWRGQRHRQTTKVCLYIHICIYRHLYWSLLLWSSGIQAHSAGFRFHSTGIQQIPVESGRMDAFLQESVGHQKVQWWGGWCLFLSLFCHWGNRVCNHWKSLSK